jgi:hypothetical protein
VSAVGGVLGFAVADGLDDAAALDAPATLALGLAARDGAALVVALGAPFASPPRR